MSEIRFRGKRIDNGEWCEGYYVYMKKSESHRIYTGDCHIYTDKDTGWWTITPTFYKVIPETVEQYTGLLDRNSKPIFGGDIIKIVPDYDYSDDYSISKVYSYNGVFCVDYHGDDFDSTALGFLEDYLPDGDFEVIGNIHDNPELLEVSE